MEIVIFCFVMLAGVVYGYYTVGGSGIAERPYGKVYGAPGALGPEQRLRSRRARLDQRLDPRRGTPARPPGAIAHSPASARPPACLRAVEALE